MRKLTKQLVKHNDKINVDVEFDEQGRKIGVIHFGETLGEVAEFRFLWNEMEDAFRSSFNAHYDEKGATGHYSRRKKEHKSKGAYYSVEDFAIELVKDFLLWEWYSEGTANSEWHKRIYAEREPVKLFLGVKDLTSELVEKELQTHKLVRVHHLGRKKINKSDARRNSRLSWRSRRVIHLTPKFFRLFDELFVSIPEQEIRDSWYFTYQRAYSLFKDSLHLDLTKEEFEEVKVDIQKLSREKDPEKAQEISYRIFARVVFAGTGASSTIHVKNALSRVTDYHPFYERRFMKYDSLRLSHPVSTTRNEKHSDERMDYLKTMWGLYFAKQTDVELYDSAFGQILVGNDGTKSAFGLDFNDYSDSLLAESFKETASSQGQSIDFTKLLGIDNSYPVSSGDSIFELPSPRKTRESKGTDDRTIVVENEEISLQDVADELGNFEVAKKVFDTLLNDAQNADVFGFEHGDANNSNMDVDGSDERQMMNARVTLPDGHKVPFRHIVKAYDDMRAKQEREEYGSDYYFNEETLYDNAKNDSAKGKRGAKKRKAPKKKRGAYRARVNKENNEVYVDDLGRTLKLTVSGDTKQKLHGLVDDKLNGGKFDPKHYDVNGSIYRLTHNLFNFKNLSHDIDIYVEILKACLIRDSKGKLITEFDSPEARDAFKRLLMPIYMKPKSLIIKYVLLKKTLEYIKQCEKDGVEPDLNDYQIARIEEFKMLNKALGLNMKRAWDYFGLLSKIRTGLTDFCNCRELPGRYFFAIESFVMILMVEALQRQGHFVVSCYDCLYIFNPNQDAVPTDEELNKLYDEAVDVVRTTVATGGLIDNIKNRKKVEKNPVFKELAFRFGISKVKNKVLGVNNFGPKQESLRPVYSTTISRVSVSRRIMMLEQLLEEKMLPVFKRVVTYDYATKIKPPRDNKKVCLEGTSETTTVSVDSMNEAETVELTKAVAGVEYTNSELEAKYMELLSKTTVSSMVSTMEAADWDATRLVEEFGLVNLTDYFVMLASYTVYNEVAELLNDVRDAVAELEYLYDVVAEKPRAGLPVTALKGYEYKDKLAVDLLYLQVADLLTLDGYRRAAGDEVLEGSFYDTETLIMERLAKVVEFPVLDEQEDEVLSTVIRESLGCPVNEEDRNRVYKENLRDFQVFDPKGERVKQSSRSTYSTSFRLWTPLSAVRVYGNVPTILPSYDKKDMSGILKQYRFENTVEMFRLATNMRLFDKVGKYNIYREAKAFAGEAVKEPVIVTESQTPEELTAEQLC